jgi:hypothetical protein
LRVSFVLAFVRVFAGARNTDAKVLPFKPRALRFPLFDLRLRRAKLCDLKITDVTATIDSQLIVFNLNKLRAVYAVCAVLSLRWLVRDLPDNPFNLRSSITLHVI